MGGTGFPARADRLESLYCYIKILMIEQCLSH